MEIEELLKKIPMEDLNSLKLIKNTKGYQWEIKIFDKDEMNLLKRVIDLDRLAKVQWGSQ